MSRGQIFRDRQHAGRQLAEHLATLHPDRMEHDVVVLGIPRGGVPVAAEVAASLRAPLDVVIVRKLGVPTQPELAMGAIGEGGVRVLNDEVVASLGITTREIDEAERRERHEIDRRINMYRDGRPSLNLRGRHVVIIDDGVATGSTAIAACRVVKASGASRVTLAVPVAPRGWRDEHAGVADETIALSEPEMFMSVGQFYDDFEQVDDDAVREILDGSQAAVEVEREEFDVELPDGRILAGTLAVPERPVGLVFFAHGSGSGRTSPRNVFVSEYLNSSRIATVLVDLMGADEDEGDFDERWLDTLADRLWRCVEQVIVNERFNTLPVGLIGSSSGAAVALAVAAHHPERVSAVVSRGGRPDLAGALIRKVSCPVLLIVGSRDRMVLGLNQQAAARMPDCGVVQVNRATHLFEEPGTLKEAARLAGGFFRLHLL